MECGKYDYRVQPGDVDLTQKASIITLGNHILHAAGEDADRLGFGLRWMQSNNTTWVLSRMAIDIPMSTSITKSKRGSATSTA